MSDIVRLKQVILNYITNAVKYSPSGNEIKIFSTVNNSKIKLCVKDSGPGLNDEEIDLVFKPFERLDAGEKGIAGTGIGLTLVRKIATAMDVPIGVDSRLGDGCTFWIEMKQASVSDQAMLKKTSLNEVYSLKPNGKNKELIKILYIEDNLINLMLVKKFIELCEGYAFIGAGSAEQGLEIIKQESPDLIFSDINLPNMNGHELLDKLKSDSCTSSIPVIAVTANAMKGDSEQGRKLGFDGYILKPFKFNQLVQAIDSALMAK